MSLLSTIFTGATIDSYTDNATLVGNTLQFDNNILGPNLYNVDISSILTGATDSYTDNVTLSGSTLQFDNNILGPNYYNVDISSILTGATDSYTDGVTLSGSTLQFDNNILGPNFYSVDLSTILTGGTTDSYTDNATLVGNTLQFDNNVFGGNFYNVDLSTIAGGPFTGNTSGNCISELHVVRLYGCPELNIMTDVIINGDLTTENLTVNDTLDVNDLEVSGDLSVDGTTILQGVTIDFTGGTQGNVLTIDSGGNAVWEEPCCSGSTTGDTMSFTVAGDNGTPFTIVSGDTLQFVGQTGLNIGVSNPEVRIAMDYSGPDSFIMAASNGTGITVDGANDKLVIYDDDASSVKYINVDQISTAGGGSFTGNTSATCITDLYVSNVYGCSPITVHSSVQHSGSTASGELAFAIGGLTQAIGGGSHSEGTLTIASGASSHAEGYLTSARNTVDHAEGSQTIADSSVGGGGPDPLAAHAEGILTKAYGSGSHAEGNATEAWGTISHAEGQLTIASGWTSHAEGWSTTANGIGSHVEGSGSTVNGVFSHASGVNNTVDGDYAKAAGGQNSVDGDFGYAHGFGNEADTFETAFGAYNDRAIGGTINLLTIGNGSGVGASRSNAFRVDFNGNTFNASGNYLAGADYAEYFESLEGNEIPVGTVVELVGRKIKVCENSENAIGVISANPGVIGNSDGGTSNEWVGKYEKDEWGTTLYESHELDLPSKVDEEGNTSTKKHKIQRRKLSKEFDSDKEYLTREERPEWNKVALLGQVRILNKQEIPIKWIKMDDINENIGLYLIR